MKDEDMSIRFDDRVVIVTGAGLGRAHALGFAARGARVLVNDLGGARDGSGGSSAAAQAVVEEIRASGGSALADSANVADEAQVNAMVRQAMDAWGRVDVLVNNAGILRDKSFAKMDMADFRLVVDVHLMGAAYCTKAVWEIMRDQGYGRIVMTTSSTGLYGNFGQTSYGAAKLAQVGFMKSLHQEGAKFGIKVNAICPVAGTRMTEDLLPPDIAALLRPEAVTPAVLYLASEDAPTNTILSAGAGGFSMARIWETDGIYLPADQWTPEAIALNMERIADPTGQKAYTAGSEHGQPYIVKAMAAKSA